MSSDYIDPRKHDVSEIVDRILRAEGIDQPEYYDTQTRRDFTQILNDWLFDPHGRGATSGLPLTHGSTPDRP